MSEKEEVIKEKIAHTGLFDFKALYSYMHSWLIEEGFGVTEEKYSEKVASGGNSRDISFLWKASKRITDYFKIDMEIEAAINELTDVEVEIDGKKKKMNKGKVGLDIKGVLTRDPDSKWDTSAFYSFIRDVYNKYVIPGKIDTVQNILRKKVKTLKEEIKSVLELTGRR